MSKSLRDMTVLYAEDDANTLHLTSMVLEDYVGRLLTASNGQEAWELFSMHRVDIVVTDILMPKMSGIELVKMIRQSHAPNTPIVITSAHTETRYLLDAINLRVDNYIIKPIDIDLLLKVLQRTILPFIQAKELQTQDLLIKAVSTFVGGKKIEIIRYLFEKCDEDNVFHGSYESIMEALDVSKPTIVRTFKQLIDCGIIIKIKNKLYKIHPEVTQKL